MGFRRQSEGCKHCRLPEDCGDTAGATCPSPQPHKVWTGCSITMRVGLAFLLVGLGPPPRPPTPTPIPSSSSWVPSLACCCLGRWDTLGKALLLDAKDRESPGPHFNCSSSQVLERYPRWLWPVAG